MENSDTFKFSEVNLAGVGTFDSSALFVFKGYQNVIIGANRQSRGFLCEALEEQYRIASKAIFPEWLVFLSNGIRFPYGGGSWEPLNEFLESLLGATTDVELFKTRVSGYVNEMLSDKVRGSSKFSHFSRPSDVLPSYTFELTEKSVMRIRDSETGDDRSGYFQAAGETLILYLAIVKAIRDSFGSEGDIPFVVDGCAFYLDHMLRDKAVNFIRRMSGQVILLDNERDIEGLDLHPNYMLEFDPATKKTSVSITNAT